MVSILGSCKCTESFMVRYFLRKFLLFYWPLVRDHEIGIKQNSAQTADEFGNINCICPRLNSPK